MDDSLGGLGPHLAALLIGGLGGSLGAMYGARTKRAQTLLAGTTGVRIGVMGAIVVLAGVLGAYRIGSSLIDAAPGDMSEVSVLLVFALGLSVGLPIGMPGLLAAWAEARRKDREVRKKRDFVPTKDDRRAYAIELVEQITDVSPRPRELSASIAGDGGTVLRFEGDIDAAEGERLTVALRADLAEVGFKRVEGQNGAREWWTRV